MKIWIKSSLRKPPQGKKVLCFTNGDIDVRQRFKDYWFPIPYVDSESDNSGEPEYWQDIDFPPCYYGYMQVFHEGKFYKMDEWEKVNPEAFNELVEDMAKVFIKVKD